MCVNDILRESPRVKSKPIIYIWYAKDWDYFFVKLEQAEDDGSKYGLNIKEATINGVKISGLK